MVDKGFWRTKDGRTIPIREMTDDHLVNTMRFLERAHRRYVDTVLLYELPDDMGDMAREAAESEMADAEESTVEELFPIYDNMQLEALRRGLIKSGTEKGLRI